MQFQTFVRRSHPPCVGRDESDITNVDIFYSVSICVCVRDQIHKFSWPRLTIDDVNRISDVFPVSEDTRTDKTGRNAERDRPDQIAHRLYLPVSAQDWKRRTPELTRRAEAIDPKQPFTVVEGFDPEKPEKCPLAFNDWFCYFGLSAGTSDCAFARPFQVGT